MLVVLRIGLIGLLLCPSLAAAQQPQKLSGSDVSPAVWGVVAIPQTPGPHPAVILLYGSSGWNPVYAQIGAQLADSGFVALALDYYAETGPAPEGAEGHARKWAAWKRTIRNAAAYLDSLPAVAGRPVGLVGYSLGAFLATSVASSIPNVRAVVDFFGGGAANADTLKQESRHLPPLLILHGEADTVVPVGRAHRLREAILAEGGKVEMHLYPGAEHAFNAPWSPNYSEPLAADSFHRMVGFLDRWLKE